MSFELPRPTRANVLAFRSRFRGFRIQEVEREDQGVSFV
jgi:hypothetical protein